MNEDSPAPSVSLLRLSRHALNFGGIAGAISSLWILIEFALGFHGARIGSLQVTTTLSLIVPIVALMLGIMRWRDRALEGKISFSQAAGVALAIGLVYAVVVAAFTWVYARFINPQYLAALVTLQVELMRQAGASAESMAKATESGTRATNEGLAIARFTFLLAMSLVVGLISALLIRKRSV